MTGFIPGFGQRRAKHRVSRGICARCFLDSTLKRKGKENFEFSPDEINSVHAADFVEKNFL